MGVRARSLPAPLNSLNMPGPVVLSPAGGSVRAAPRAPVHLLTSVAGGGLDTAATGLYSAESQTRLLSMLLSAAGSSGYKFLAAAAGRLDNAAGIRAIIAPVVLISPQNGLVTTRRGGRQQSSLAAANPHPTPQKPSNIH